MTPIAIGRLAELSGVKVTTIRYYESIGLLAPPPRTGGNRRLYGQPEVERLTFIRRSRDFGLSVNAIRELLTLELDQAQSCRAATRIAQSHLAAIGRRIAELEALEAHFRTMIDHCNGERVATCAILKDLHGAP